MSVIERSNVKPKLMKAIVIMLSKQIFLPALFTSGLLFHLEDKVKESVVSRVCHARPPPLVARLHKSSSGRAMSKSNRLDSHVSTRKRRFLLLKMLYIKD